MSIEIAKQLAEFTTKTKFEEIPAETVEFTKGLTLKTVAGMLVGSSMPTGRKVAKFMRERGGLSEVGVIGSGFKTSLWNAVLADAIFAHVAELEDDRFEGGTAWDITVFPITFPLAEKLRLSGKELLEISAIGLEVHARTTMFFPQGHLGLTVVPGAMGPSAAAARALGLNETETMSALGLSMSAAGVAYVNFGTDSHYFESALQSLQGMIAAELAKEGLTSNPDVVTFLSNMLGEEKVVPKKFVENLGTEWLVHRIWIKKYPCCFLMHRHIDALLELITEQNLSYEQIENVTAHVGPRVEVCNRAEPQSIGDLQFSFHHVLAAVMLDKDVNFSHITEEKILDSKFKEARSKVEVVVHPDWVSEYIMGTPARLDVRLKDSSEFSRERMYAIGSPAEPLTAEQFKQLFIKFTQEVLPEEKIKWTADALANLEKLDRGEVEKLMDVLVFKDKV